MKKVTISCVVAALLLSGCGTYAGSGSYTGATFGSVLGSAIGGLSGGPRGSNIGTIIGMAGGAVIGGAIGEAADYTGTYSAQQPTETMPLQSSVEMSVGHLSYAPHIEIRNARFVDDDQDGAISRGELCKVIFEVVNTGKTAIYDVQPTVIDASRNKHIFISPSMHVESIAPGKGIRYTALVKADDRLKSGKVKICLSVLQGDKAISKIVEFNIPARK